MTDAETLLCAMTMRRWLSLGPTDRLAVGEALSQAVPRELQLASLAGHAAAPPLPFFVHQPTQLGFYLVFGDRFVMGSTAELLHAVKAGWSRLDADDDRGPILKERKRALAALEKLAPAREVDVAPFFLAEAALSSQWHTRFALHGLPKPGDFNRAAREQLEARGWRLPSEAELDFAGVLVHLTGDAAFGKGLGTGWCADTWHDDFTGAPPDSEPWGDGATVERVLYGRVRFDATARRATLRPAFSLLAQDVAWSPEARTARAERGCWKPSW